MIESAEASARIHGCLPRWPLFDWPVMRGVLREAVVNPILVIVRNVFTDEAPQVLFVQGNHVVQHFPPTATHPSLSDTVAKVPGHSFVWTSVQLPSARRPPRH